MTMLTRCRLRATVAIIACMVIAACSSGGTGTAPTGNDATGEARLTIGIADDQPGVSLKVGPSYQGFDVDTANFVAGKLGVPTKNITWKVLAQADRIPALADGEVDLVVSALSITPERQQQIAFSKPYFVAHKDLLVRLNDDSITGPETLHGKILCAAAGTTSAAYVTARYKGDITLREVPTWSECVRDLANGDVDAVAADDLILAGFAAQPQYKGIIEVLGKGFTDEQYGVGIKKGDTAMADKVNAALKEYMSSGAWKKSLDTWVAPSGYRIPSPPTID